MLDVMCTGTSCKLLDKSSSLGIFRGSSTASALIVEVPGSGISEEDCSETLFFREEFLELFLLFPAALEFLEDSLGLEASLFPVILTVFAMLASSEHDNKVNMSV